MCPFITQRVNEGRRWKAVLSTISFLFGLLMVISAAMAFKQRETAAAMFAIVFAILTIWPALKYYHHANERSLASSIGCQLELLSDRTYGYAQLEKALHSSDAVSLMRKLLKNDYMTGFEMDDKNRKVTLTAVVTEGRVNVSCPACGASRYVLPGCSAKCELCGKPLPVPKDEDEQENIR